MFYHRRDGLSTGAEIALCAFQYIFCRLILQNPFTVRILLLSLACTQLLLRREASKRWKSFFRLGNSAFLSFKKLV